MYMCIDRYLVSMFNIEHTHKGVTTQPHAGEATWGRWWKAWGGVV